MNKHNAKDFIPLVQALVDGKTIQFQAKRGDEWKNVSILDTKTWNAWQFRIAPEPREWKACVILSGSEAGMLAGYDKGDEERIPLYEVVRVREILD